MPKVDRRAGRTSQVSKTVKPKMVYLAGDKKAVKDLKAYLKIHHPEVKVLTRRYSASLNVNHKMWGGGLDKFLSVCYGE